MNHPLGRNDWTESPSCSSTHVLRSTICTTGLTSSVHKSELLQQRTFTRFNLSASEEACCVLPLAFLPVLGLVCSRLLSQLREVELLFARSHSGPHAVSAYSHPEIRVGDGKLDLASTADLCKHVLWVALL